MTTADSDHARVEALGDIRMVRATTIETKTSNLQDELVVALNGFLWLGNNLHNVTADPARFVELYEAALVGVRDLVTKAQ